VKVTPAAFSWTEFDVVDVNGSVKILARKGDLTINDGNETFTLAQGQETTKDETSDTDKNGKKKDKKRASGAAPAAGGGILSSPWAIGIGGAAIVGVTTWVLVQNNNPASPSTP
jgi:hypothetical protein